MGMIQTFIKKTPEGKTPWEFRSEVEKRLPEYSVGADGAIVGFLTPDNFDEHWDNQENLKKTDEIRDKYRKLTSEGKVIFVEIDW